MAQVSMTPSNATPLDVEQRHQVHEQLERILADLIALSLIGKQAHWNVIGPNFRPLHAQFDELVDAARGWSDTVAERLVAIGIYPDGQADDVARTSDIEPLPSGAIEDRRLVLLMADRVTAAGERARTAMDDLGDVDVVSQDVLTEVVHGLEKQAWMLRAQIH